MMREQVGQQPIIGDEHNPPEKYVTISVDDGHPTDLRSVDLLHKYGLKATFYVPGANGDRTVMKACEIREIDRQFEVRQPHPKSFALDQAPCPNGLARDM